MPPAEEDMMMEDREEDLSSDDDSDSDSDSEDEELDALKLGITGLEQRVRDTHGRDYDAHALLVKVLREKNQMPKLEKARKAFSKNFPLPEELWLEWIEDEGRVAMSDEDKEGLATLFDKAIADYSTVNMWLVFTAHLKERFYSYEVGTEKKCIMEQRTRDTYESAIKAMGLNLAESHRLLAAYREFEQQLLKEMRAQTDLDASIVSAQAGRVRSTFQRQLAEPGPTLDAVLDEYGSWEEDKDLLAKSSEACVAAKKAYADREGFEAGVRQATAETVVSCWVDYGVFEQSKGTQERAICVMERGSLMCCLSPQYWQAYVACVVASGGDASTVYARAVRNCPESSPLWCGYMLDLEKKGAGRNDLKGGDGTSDKLTATYNSAVLATRKSHDDCLQVHLSYCDHVRRCVKSGRVSEGQMRECFETAVNKMHEMHPNSAGTRMLRIYWGECEAFTAGDVDYARKVWDQALKGCKQLEVWENVIALERSVRPGGQARALLKKGCNLLEGTAQEALARVYVDYERREGDLESFVQAVEKFPDAQVRASVKPKKVRKEKKANADDPEKAKRREAVMQKWAERKAGEAASASDQPLGKRKRDAEGGAAEAKQGKSAATDKKKKGADGEAVGGGSGAGDEHGSIREGDDALKHSIFVQNLPKTATDDAVRALFESCGTVQGVRVVKDKFGSAKGFAYIDFETEEDVRKALEPVEGGRKIQGRLIEVSKSRPLKGGSGDSSDGRTLYVNGLTFKATKESIMAVFADCGDVEDVRILRESDGKIRGFCYVQFKTADGAKAGLSKNGHALDGKNLKVALSNPGAKRPAAGGGGGGPPLRDHSGGGGRGGKSMLSLVPRAVKRPAPPGSKPGLGSRPQAASATSGGGSGEATAKPAGSDKADKSGGGDAKKDNDYFKNLFSKGSNL